VALAFAVVAGQAHARPPSYTVSGLSFSTSLHGVQEDAVPEPCPVEKCKDPRAVVVARGESGEGSARVTVTVREHRGIGKAKVEGLLALSRRLSTSDAQPHEVRVVQGHAGGAPTVEQWLTTASCDRAVVARVLVALEDKIVEIETAAPAGATDEKHVAKASNRMHSILSAMRIRRLDSAVLSPTKDAPAPHVLADRTGKSAC
jgi:hypothetical protein